MIIEKIRKQIEKIDLLKGVDLEVPKEEGRGDLAIPVFKIAKEKGEKPMEVAKKIEEEISGLGSKEISKTEAIEPGFVNIYLSEEVLRENLEEILKEGDSFGKSGNGGEKVMVEYTDPNPFKKFHIGHLMSNAIGEAISRLYEFGGAEIKRACYQGDVGIHVAKAIWAGKEGLGNVVDGTAYVAGAKAYEENDKAKEEIEEINEKIYEGKDEEVNSLYEKGKKESLEDFEKIYKRLGTKFDCYFLESETGEVGKEIVKENIGDVFEESEGAVIFKGEKFDPKLHTRVFINSKGLPTYEAKELGLAKVKEEEWNFDKSVVITGNEVDAYFRVVLKAMEMVLPKERKKIEHVSHGFLRLPTGKMSSRTGEVIAGEELIEKVKEEIYKNVSEREGFDEKNWEKVADKVAVGAIKYSILKQAPGRDIVFDFEKSISFEGDSGPYLQYTYARINSVLEQAGERAKVKEIDYFKESELVRFLVRFNNRVEKAKETESPQLMAEYLHKLASIFNSYYAENKIVSEEENSDFRVALAKATGQVLKNGMWILGIEAVERM